jgi:putative membrane protein
MIKKEKNILFISTLVLVIVHLAGVIGIHSCYNDTFLSLTPANLVLSASLLICNQKEFNPAFFIFLVSTFLIGFFIEVVGVHTGIVFGWYTYGERLGFKLWDVPLVMGLNWLVLIFAAGVISNRIRSNKFVKSAVGACLLIVLDFVLEPVAIKFGFWSWSGSIPLKNYVAWYLISYILLLLFHSLQFNKENKLAQPLYIIQLVFFVLLCVF